MNQPLRQLVSVIVLLVVLIGLGAAASNYAQRYPQPFSQTTTAQTIRYEGEEGKTVLELLQQKHTVETRETSFGTFVTTIDGAASTENTAWIYYIDNKQGTVAADEATTQTGQTIEWRYESF